MIQSCSSVLGLVLSGDDPSHQRHKSTTPLPASGGLNRTGSVLLKSGAPSASGSAQTAGGSQRSVSPEKSEPRGTKRKRGGSPESNHRPKTTVQPHIEDSDSSDENASEDSQSEESEGELRWSTLKEDPAVRWHRAPADDDDWDPSSAQRFNEQYTWKSTTRRQARGSDTFTKLGNSAGFITSYSKPSLARMIVHPCLGHSAQVVLDNNPDGNGSKSKASLEIPLRPAEPDPRRTVPSRLSFEELAEAVGFNSEWLSSQSEEEASRSASSSHQNTAEGASKDDKKGKPKARKSTAPPASVSLVPGGIQQLPMDGPESESPFASTSASKAEDLDTKAKHRRSKTTEQSTQQRPAAGSMRRGKAQMVFEKPQWVWHALMEKIKSEEVPKQVVPPKIWAALHEEGEETGQSDADEVQGDDGLSANEKAMDRGSARAGSIPDT